MNITLFGKEYQFKELENVVSSDNRLSFLHTGQGLKSFHQVFSNLLFP
jgi:hypothetical protein